MTASPLHRFSSFQTLGDLFASHVAARPDALAIRFGDEALSYRMLQERGARIATGLQQMGLPSGTRIATLAKNNSRHFEILAAAALANMVLSPINWRLAEPEIVELLQLFDARVLVIDPEYLDYLPRITAQCPDLQLVLVLGAPVAGLRAFDVWRDAHDPGALRPARPGPADIVVQMHTSGTVGRPKGVMISHRNLLGQMAYSAETDELGAWTPEDLALVVLPLFHVGGTSYAMQAMSVGASVLLLREAKSDLILEAFADHPVTKAGFVPAVIQALINDPAFRPDLIRALRTVTFGGSPITPALLAEAIAKLDCDFVQMFGMTESTSVATSMFIDRSNPPDAGVLASCGRAMSGFGLRIIDPAGRDLPTGQSGEILLQSATITEGYYNQPDVTAAAIQNGWYHTGDAGFVDAEGYLYLRDRIKDMIITGGENVYPAEVENALATHSAVLESGVIGIPSVKWGEEVQAFVVLRAGRTASAEDLTAHCKSRIAAYKCPKSIVFIEALPRNPSGKILKRTLRETSPRH